MNIIKLFQELPFKIAYEGYTFFLEVRGYEVGYFLHGIFTKNKDKRRTFKKEGLWVWDGKGKVPVSSFNSNFLFKTIIFEDTDEALNEALNELLTLLKLNNILTPSVESVTVDAEYQEFIINQLL